MMFANGVGINEYKPNTPAFMVVLGASYSAYKKLWSAVMGMLFYDFMMLLMLLAIGINSTVYINTVESVSVIVSLVFISMLVLDSFNKAKWAGVLSNVILQNIPLNSKTQFSKVMGYAPLVLGPLIIFALEGNHNSLLPYWLVCALVFIWASLRVYLHRVIEHIEMLISNKKVMTNEGPMEVVSEPVKGESVRLYVTLGIILTFALSSVVMGFQEQLSKKEWLMYAPLLMLLCVGFAKAFHYCYVVINLIHDQKQFMFEEAMKRRHLGEFYEPDEEKESQVNQEAWFYLDDRRFYLEKFANKAMKFAVPYAVMIMFIETSGSTVGGVYGVLLVALYYLKTAIYDIDFTKHLEPINEENYFNEEQ